MIEVNDYIRTKNGVIGKVIKVLSNRVFLDNLGYAVLIKDILKHSKQLIDLVEVGDYVNGREVLDIYKPRDLWEPIEIRVNSRYTNFILADEIQTILTKEQYMANCYKVGGKQWD